MRAAIYARYSSDLQREASIDDQLRICRRLIDGRGWTAGRAYTDQGISGSSLLRPGYQAMMADARAGQFDVLVAESIDRLSRDQEHIAALFKQLGFLGVPIVTVAEGEISELHVGLKGTMAALFLKDLAQKTRRGMEGRVREGKAAGGLSYGYRVHRDVLPNGDHTTGDRTIDQAQAAVVIRIFRAFAAGMSPRAIAAMLNREEIPCPSGATWGASTIYGNWRRGTGLLNNELYIGRTVWNRQHFIKDPATGRRQARMNPPAAWITKDVPALRIVDQDLWDAVKARQGATRRVSAAESDGDRRPERARRNRHLLSGLLECGCCGSAYTLSGSNYYGCAAARNKGTCDNRRLIKRTDLEERVLGGLKEKLLHPDLIAAFVEEYRQEFNRSRQEELARRQTLDAELGKLTRAIAQIVDAIADGMYHPSMKEKMAELERRKQSVEADLDTLPDETPLRFHPGAAAIYRAKVADLTTALNADETTRVEAAEILRGLISAVRLTPDEAGGFTIELVGELAAILALGENAKSPDHGDRGFSTTVVAGAGFEPTTFRL